MLIRKEVHALNHVEPFTVLYVKNEKKQSDATLYLYSTYKISIHLSDGLAGVFDNRLHGAEQGSVTFFRPDEIHFGRFLRAGIHEYITFYIPLSYFDCFCESSAMLAFFEDHSLDRINCIKADGVRQKKLMDTARETVAVLSAEGETDHTRLFSLMLDVILFCRDNYEEQKNKPPTEPVPHYVSGALAYIAEHFCEKITLETISEEIGCSAAYLSRIFKSYTGVTVYKHLTDMRIGNAARMLKNGASVTEACFGSGFNDCSNFIRTFKDIMGETPHRYKKTEIL